MLTWGIVGLVVVIVAVLVIVAVSSGGHTNASGPEITNLAPSSIVTELTSVPLTVFNQVGITSSEAAVSPPISVSGQPPLTFTSGGTTLPGIYYYGAEYCPYCAAERWPMILALSRFGQFTGIGLMQSSSTDVYANTPTFTFAKATYTSPYLAAHLDEYLSNQVSNAGQYKVLQVPTRQEAALVRTYDSAAYFGGAPDDYPAFPFIDFGNTVLQLSSSYSPQLLSGRTQAQIAADLDNPGDPVTQAIVATANYLTAGICATTDNRPATVCKSPGVRAADAVIKRNAGSGSGGARAPSTTTPTPSPTTTEPTAQTGAAAEQAAANQLAVAAGCPASPTARANTLTWSKAPPMTIDTSATYVATVDTTAGTFAITLDASAAPTTVNSFVFLAQQNYFKCTIFHRVIPGFVDQGGDPTGTGTGGPGYQFKNENIPKSYATGNVAMANSGPNTNGSQFFLVVPGGAEQLDNDLTGGDSGYSLFGQITQGMSVVQKINAEGTSSGTPAVYQRILSVTIAPA